MGSKKYRVLALIHIGSELISLQIAEYRDWTKVRVIEQASHKVRLGEETFKHQKIPFEMVSEICELLKGYKRLMQEYGVTEYTAQATTAVREAENQVYFLDQVYVKTGIKVEVIDLPKEIYTKFASIRMNLKKEKIREEDGMLLVDISSGGLGVTYVRGSKIVYQQNLHIGIIRIKEDFEHSQKSSIHFNRALTEYIASTIGPVREALAKEKIGYLVLSGAETELILKMLGRRIADTHHEQIERVETASFVDFYDEIREMNLSQIINAFNIEKTSAEIIFPTIILYRQLLALAPVDEVLIMPDRFIDGMRLLYLVRELDGEQLAKLQDELISLVHCIGARYKYDSKHVAQVEYIALAVFDKLAKKYDLDDHSRLLLRAACVLHDIGKYICLRSHTRYSYDLIMASDMIGFSDTDKKIIALTTYYHSHLPFAQNDRIRPQIDRDQVPLVAKLAAILRLADALDRSYKQKIEKCQVVLKGGELAIQARSRMDLSLEEWTFANKKNLFLEVFGIMPKIERVGDI